MAQEQSPPANPIHLHGLRRARTCLHKLARYAIAAPTMDLRELLMAAWARSAKRPRRRFLPRHRCSLTTCGHSSRSTAPSKCPSTAPEREHVCTWAALLGTTTSTCAALHWGACRHALWAAPAPAAMAAAPAATSYERPRLHAPCSNDIVGLQIYVGSAQTQVDNSRNLTIYISPTSEYRKGALCVANYNATATDAVPNNVTCAVTLSNAKYVTVERYISSGISSPQTSLMVRYGAVPSCSTPQPHHCHDATHACVLGDCGLFVKDSCPNNTARSDVGMT